MATRSSRTERRWRRIVEEWWRSGLSGPRYAEREGVSVGTLYRWNRRLRQQDAASAEFTPPAVPRLLPVAIIDEVPAVARESTSALEVVLPGGEVIRVAADADLSHLGRVVAALRGGAA